MLTVTVDKRVLVWACVILINGLIIYGAYKKGYRNGVDFVIDYIERSQSTKQIT